MKPCKSAFALALCLGAASTSAHAADSDGDGVLDTLDAFPCDATLSMHAFSPAEGQFGTLMFEDEWPFAGDQDFNDLVLDWNFQAALDAAGHVHTLEVSFDVVALGGQYALGLGLGLPVPKASLQSATLAVDGGPAQAISPSVADADTVFTISDLRGVLGLPAGPLNVAANGALAASKRITLKIQFDGTAPLSLGLAPFDTFVIRTGPEAGPGHEIHRPGYAGTANMNPALFNTADDGSTPSRNFVDLLGLPFAISTPTRSDYPNEQTHLAALFPDVLSFAGSGGATHTNFYVINAQASHRFAGRVQGVGLVTPVADNSCVGLRDCDDVLSDGGTTDGTYTIDPDGPGGVAPFDVFCQQSTDGGGWIKLQLANAGPDFVFRTIPNSSNTDVARTGDQARYYRHLGVDGFSGVEFNHNANTTAPNMTTLDVQYRHPTTGAVYTPEQVAALRTRITALHPRTRQSVGAVDDWGMGGMRGHEIYVSDGAGQNFINLTWGTQPADEQSGFYLYHTEPELTATDNITNSTGHAYGDASYPANAPVTVLPPEYILPAKIRLGWDNPNSAQWGGGAFWGFEDSTFLVGAGPLPRPVANGGVYSYSDGSYAASCLEYFVASTRTGVDGTYAIDPAGNGGPILVHCDMARGGYIQLDLQTRFWGRDIGITGGRVDPIGDAKTRVQGPNSQQNLNNLTNCSGDSQVTMQWLDANDTPLSAADVAEIATVTTSGLVADYYIFDADGGANWDQVKGCANGVVVMYGDGNEYGAQPNRIWSGPFGVDYIAGPFTTGIYGGNSDASGYDVSLPRTWFFR